MPRQARLEFAGGWYHIIHRSFAGHAIFSHDDDRLFFLSRIGKACERWEVEVHAYSLMDTHFHLMIHTPKGNLPAAMHYLNGVYTQFFNRVHGSEGPLLRGRYKSILLEKDSYFLELVRYIHLNPVRANVCAAPEVHAWSSHRAYLNPELRFPWLVTDNVLGEFGGDTHEGIIQLDKFVKAGVPDHIAGELCGESPPSVLGSKSFIEGLFQP